LLVVGAAGAAALLGLGGFLAGQALAGRGDRITLTSADRSLAGQEPAQGQGQGQGRGSQAGGRGFGDQDGDSGGDHDGDGRIQFDPVRMTAGVITSTGSDRLVLRTRDGASVTVAVTGRTTVRGVADTVGELQVGHVVIVRGERQDDGSYMASELLVGPQHDGGRQGVPDGDRSDGETTRI
jgi:hypothetical protein